jgi:hypothetical protein
MAASVSARFSGLFWYISLRSRVIILKGNLRIDVRNMIDLRGHQIVLLLMAWG